MGSIEITNGDITKLSTDALVCPAHKHLIKGSGLSAQVFDLAGEALTTECNALEACPVGGARITSAPNLPADYIIHTVTPQWTGGDQWGITALEQLRDCYKNVIKLAKDKQVKHLTIPALATGANNTPHSMAAHVALDELLKHADDFERITVCLHSEGNQQEWTKTLNKFYAA